jgi:hypothetical protein
MDPTKVGSFAVNLVAKPLEGLALLTMAVAAIAGIGVSANWWTLDEVMALVTPIVGNVAIALVKIVGPVADLALVVALVTALHSLKKGMEIGIAAGIVAGISWHFGGQDWISALPSLIGHHVAASGR